MKISNSILHSPALLLVAACAVLTPAARSAEATPHSSAITAPEGYRLTVRDTIEVTIFDEPDLQASRPIDSRGQVALPLLTSPVHVAGLTVREAEDLVQSLYLEGKFLKHPAASIKIVEYAPREVEVVGEVNQQGMLKFPNEKTSLDITEVIARCGGFTQLAKRSAIEVVHVSDDGKEVKFNVNYDDQKRPGRERVMIFPGDKIRVLPIIF